MTIVLFTVTHRTGFVRNAIVPLVWVCPPAALFSYATVDS